VPSLPADGRHVSFKNQTMDEVQKNKIMSVSHTPASESYIIELKNSVSLSRSAITNEDGSILL
jgi:hypothetical protein